MSADAKVVCMLSLAFCVAIAAAAVGGEPEMLPLESNVGSAPVKSDLDTAATSAKLFNLGSLLGRQPYYGNSYGNSYGSGYNPNVYRPTYPSTGSYYPSSGSYYPSTSWTGSNYYPSTGGSYYPTTSGGYYPGTSGGGYYPSTSGGGYYPNTGTNILGGNGGYGGYGGNGGLHQYNGYWNPNYTGHRNRGYGYLAGTDRYGLPSRNRNSYAYGGSAGSAGYGSRDRDPVLGSYRGYD